VLRFSIRPPPTRTYTPPPASASANHSNRTHVIRDRVPRRVTSRVCSRRTTFLLAFIPAHPATHHIIQTTHLGARHTYAHTPLPTSIFRYASSQDLARPPPHSAARTNHFGPNVQTIIPAATSLRCSSTLSLERAHHKAAAPAHTRYSADDKAEPQERGWGTRRGHGSGTRRKKLRGGVGKADVVCKPMDMAG
jgi:hypothetical protein